MSLRNTLRPIKLCTPWRGNNFPSFDSCQKTKDKKTKDRGSWLLILAIIIIVDYSLCRAAYMNTLTELPYSHSPLEVPSFHAPYKFIQL